LLFTYNFNKCFLYISKNLKKILTTVSCCLGCSRSGLAVVLVVGTHGTTAWGVVMVEVVGVVVLTAPAPALVARPRKYASLAAARSLT